VKNPDHLKSKTILAVITQLSVTLSLLILTKPTVTYDGWQYISSGNSIFDGTFFSNYFFVRQPGYPLFVGACLRIIDSLWFLAFIQILINVISINYFANTVSKLFKFSTITRKRNAKIVALCLVWVFLGSYPSYVLAQNLFAPLILFFASFLINDYLRDTTKLRRVELVKWNAYNLIILAISFVLAKEIFVIIFVSFILHIILNNQRSKSNLLLIAVALGIACFQNIVINNIKDMASVSIEYNQQNKEDVFAKNNLLENLVSRIKIDPPYTQTIFQAALANLDIVPTLGWDGITSSKYQQPGHPARAFGMNHILQNGQICNVFPNEGVIAVTFDYVRKYANCERLNISIPTIFKFPAYALYLLMWPLILAYFTYSMFRSKRFILGILPISTIATYSFFGAGISRYGSPIFPIIIVCSILSLFEVLESKKWSETFSRRSGTKVRGLFRNLD
jgi:hypothetical protein